VTVGVSVGRLSWAWSGWGSGDRWVLTWAGTLGSRDRPGVPVGVSRWRLGGVAVASSVGVASGSRSACGCAWRCWRGRLCWALPCGVLRGMLRSRLVGVGVACLWICGRVWFGVGVLVRGLFGVAVGVSVGVGVRGGRVFRDGRGRSRGVGWRWRLRRVSVGVSVGVACGWGCTLASPSA